MTDGLEVMLMTVIGWSFRNAACKCARDERKSWEKDEKHAVRTDGSHQRQSRHALLYFSEEREDVTVSPASESELLSEDLGQKRRVMLDV